MSAQQWTLRVNLNGEWEECRFQTQMEALEALHSLTRDYSGGIQRAILFRTSPLRPTPNVSSPANKYIN